MGRLKQKVEDLRDRNLVISNETTKYLRFESWSPIMGALLLSGVRPSSRWIDAPPAEIHRDDEPVSHRDLFLELLSTMKASERGLDNEPIFRSSPRFKCAENILLFWDQVCSFHKDYPIDLPPKDFSVWMWSMNREGHVHIPDSMWLDAFVNNFSLKQFATVVPKELLMWLTTGSKKAWEIIPKHKFGREIALVLAEAKQEGGATDDPDEILSRLAGMMRRDEIPGVKLVEYTRKSNIRYLHEGVRDVCTLRRDSFARQLRRMIAKDKTSNDAAEASLPSNKAFPFIKSVAVESMAINKFTSNDRLRELVRDLLRETIAYVRLAASVKTSDLGWPLEQAVLVGNIVRLSKLLSAIDAFAALQMTGMLLLMMPLAIESMVDLKYLVENHDAFLVDSYVGTSSVKSRKSRKKSWSELTLEHKAEATGLSDLFKHVLQDSPSHLHGSWKDLTKHHLTANGEDRYQAKLTWSELNPKPLISISLVALVVTHGFTRAVASGPAVEDILKGIEDLYRRLKITDERLEKLLYERWS